MRTSENLRYLYDRFLNHESSPEKVQMLFKHFGTADETLLRALIRQQLAKKELPELLPDPAQPDRLYLELTASIHQDKQKKYRYCGP